MNKIVRLIAAAVVVAVIAGCGGLPDTGAPAPDPGVAVVGAPKTEAAAPGRAVGVTGAAQAESSWIDNVDLDKVLTSPWLIAGVFLLVQWFEIWYFNRTGKKSATIDAVEAAMAPKLGIVQRALYRLWRWGYFKKHPDKKDPDKQEEEKKN